MLNNNGNIIEKSHYYPTGIRYYAESTSSTITLPFRYNSKEFMTINGLNRYDYGARFYDPSIGRWHTVDPKAEKYKSWSPYNFVADNPINLIDPNGMDWNTDKDKSYQYDPNVTKDSRLKDGQTYVGKTHDIKNGNGDIITSYRKDGSIFFANDMDAIKRISDNDKKYDKEELGFFTDGGVLITPDYKNTRPKCTPTGEENYNYTLEDNVLKDANGNAFNVYGSIHTHFGDTDPYPSGTSQYGDVGDRQYFSRFTPNKPALTLDESGNIQGIIGKYTPAGDNRWGWLPNMSIGNFKNDKDLRLRISKFYIK